MSRYRIIDITTPLARGSIAWPGDTRFSREEKKGTAIVSKLVMSSHSGTHIDAPRHFLFGKSGVDQIALSKLVGKAKVIEVKSKKFIEISDLQKNKILSGDKLLFKTRNSRLLKKKQFRADYVSLSLEAARFLASKKIDLVGTDYFGIEAKSAPGHPVHKALLRAGVVIVEGLDLSKVKPGKYNLAALPLKIKAGDGSPARAVLWK